MSISRRPGLDHIFIQLGPAPPTPPSLPNLPARTCVGTLPCWAPMWHYRAKLHLFKVDITFIVPKLIDGVPSHAKGAWWLKWQGIVTLVPNGQRGRAPTQVHVGRPGSEGSVGGAGLSRMKTWSSPGLLRLRVGLHYSGEVHRSWKKRRFSIVIGRKYNSWPVGVYTRWRKQWWWTFLMDDKMT